MAIIFPTNTEDTIDAIRLAIGRDVKFQTELTTICPVCSGVDPVTSSPLNPYCTTCSGTGYLTTISGEDILAHITWNPSETLQWVSGGQYEGLDCIVQIKYTPHSVDTVNHVNTVVVDGKTMSIRRKTYRGVKDLNRIILGLEEV